MLQGSIISYRDKNYRVQDANGWKHIIVTEAGSKKRIGLNQINQQQQKDAVFDYVFGGGSVAYPCPAMDYFIYRHRMRRHITVTDYAIKFKVKIKK